jgi:hypothetical protein
MSIIGKARRRWTAPVGGLCGWIMQAIWPRHVRVRLLKKFEAPG